MPRKKRPVLEQDDEFSSEDDVPLSSLSKRQDPASNIPGGDGSGPSSSRTPRIRRAVQQSKKKSRCEIGEEEQGDRQSSDDEEEDPNFTVENSSTSSLSSSESEFSDDEEDNEAFASEDDEPERTLQVQSPSGSSQGGSGDGSSGTATPILHPGTPTPSSTWKTVQLNSGPSFPRFVHSPQVAVDLSGKSPCDLFELFVNDDVWKIMVDETNRYAGQFLAEARLKRKSRAKDWAPTNIPEMKRFVGILLVMGLVRLPALDKYWSKGDLYGVPLVKKAMRRDRFSLLLRFWHFADNSQAQPQDRLHKIRPLVQLLNENFKQVRKPGEDLVIDETMVPWRGRLVFRQYIPNKAHKYGVKLYKVCAEDGFTYRLSVYCGRSDVPSNNMHADQVVRDLTEDWRGVGRTVYADNFYTSLPLAKFLIGENTHLVGTLRSNRRGLPREVTKAKLQKGDIVGRQDEDGIKIFAWRDKRVVFMLSTRPSHDATLVPTGNSRKGTPVVKPQSVLDYNRRKKGVDLSDQMSTYYTSLRKTIRWYKKVVLELLTGTAAVNAWILHTEHQGGVTMSLLHFREAIARALIEGPEEEEDDEVSAASPAPSGRGRKTHRLGTYDRGASNRVMRKRCLSCYARLRKDGKERPAAYNATPKVHMFCMDCEGNPAMCLQCFNSLKQI